MAAYENETAHDQQDGGGSGDDDREPPKFYEYVRPFLWRDEDDGKTCEVRSCVVRTRSLLLVRPDVTCA